MKIFNIFKNRIIKDTISILFIFLFLFENIAPLTINAYSNPIESKKNYSQKIYPQENEFSFYLRSKYYSGYVKEEIDKIENAQFYPIEFPSKYNPQFLIGIVEVTNDKDPISKEIGKDVFLGMRKDEIINEINNKYKNRMWNYNEKNVYNYSIKNQNIIVNLDSMIVDRTAKGGIAVILEVLNLPMMNNTPVINKGFELRSICINDNSENEGIIRIDNKDYSLPNSIELLKNNIYQIYYKSNEGYEFDHWEITGGKLVYKNNESSNILYVQDDFGEIIAYYKKIGEIITTTNSSITSLETSQTSTTSIKTSSSSIRTTQQITTKTTSLTSTKTEIKTTSSISTTTSSIKQEEENFIDKYIVTPINEYIINPIIRYIVEPINEYIVKPFVKYVIEPILKYIIQPFIEYIIKPIIEIIKIILDIIGRIINTITGKNKETYTTIQSFTSYSTEYKTYEKTKSIEEEKTYKEYLTSYEKTKYDSTRIIISYETKINTIYITKTIKTIGNKEIITTYPITTTIYEEPHTITTTSSIINYETLDTSTILTTIPKKTTTIYEETITIKNTEEPITKYKEITNTISTTTSVKVTMPSSTRTITSYKTSNIIYTTTISNYKYATTKTITTTTTYPIKTETIYVTVTGFTTTYKTPIYTYTTIVTNTKSSSEFYGGGGGGRGGPLLRDSLISHPRIYKEFLKKKEDRKLPLLYLVYKVTPLRVKQYENYYNKMKVYKINTRIKNYDNKERSCILSIGRINEEPIGFFLNKPIVPYSEYSLNSILENEKYSKEIEIKDKININLKGYGEDKKERQILFLQDTNYLRLCLYVYINNEPKLIDIEPEYHEGSIISPFWRGFWDAIKDRAPGIIVSTGLIVAIGLTGGTAHIMLVTTAFLLKLQSAAIEAMNIYEACVNINSLLDIVNKYEYISNIARSNNLIDASEYFKEEVDIKRNEIFKAAASVGLDLFLNVKLDSLSIAFGIEKAKSEYEKGYATGDTLASILNIISFVAVTASIRKLNDNLNNKISLWNIIKDSLKAWLSPNIQDFIIIAKNKLGKIYPDKIDNILEKISGIGLICSKSEIAQNRIKNDLDLFFKDLTEEKIKEKPFLLDEAINKIDPYYSIAWKIAKAGEGRGKNFIGEIFKVAGDIYGITGKLDFTKDIFETLESFPKKGEIEKAGFEKDPIKVAKDYLSKEENIQILKKGWDVLEEKDYKKLFKSFISWESSLEKEEKIEQLNNIFNNYINSKRKQKINILSNTLDWTYNLKTHITSEISPNYDMRSTLFDHAIRFLNYWDLEYTKNLNDDTLKKINSIINNFRNTYDLEDSKDVKLAYKRFLHIDNLFYDYVLEKDESGNIKVNQDLFNDWIDKVLKTSSSKNEFLAFMNTEINEGREIYHAYVKKEVVGKDTTFISLKVPIKIEGNEINGYVPLIISTKGEIHIPEKVGNLLVNTKYVPGNKGFMIISTDISNGKIFAPVMVESGYKIAILEWTKKALSLSFPDYGKIEDGNLIVNWKELIKNEMILKATIVKPDGTIVATRYVLFKPDLKEIRMGLGSDNCRKKGITQYSDVLVIFDFIKMGDIKDYEAIEKISRAYGSVMGLRECDVTSDPEKGLLGEYRICQIILENTLKGAIVDVRIDGGKIDIETTKHLIEVKYWDDETTKYEKDIKELIKELKENYIKYNEEKYKNGKKIVLTFYKELSDEALNRVIEEIKNNFEDWNNWLTILNGHNRFEIFITNEYKD
ncbi:MAG: hypothetical protein QXP60_03695 [Nitrososphaerota archaeon]